LGIGIDQELVGELRHEVHTCLLAQAFEVVEYMRVEHGSKVLHEGIWVGGGIQVVLRGVADSFRARS
jgi:hypothetical protein